MSKKILLAGGCSYTDKDFVSRDKSLPEDQQSGWKFWPEIMAKELNLQSVNVGKCGRGADYIFNAIVRNIAIYDDRIDTVAVLWSGSDRESFYIYDFNALVEIDDPNKFKNPDGTLFDPFEWMETIGIGKVNRRFWESKHFNKTIYHYMIDNQLSKMLALLELCRAKNIKVVMSQGLIFLNYHIIQSLYESGHINKNAYISKIELINYYYKSPFFQYLEKEKENIIGWPFWSQLGGFTLEDERNKFGPKKYFISEKDRHPNAECQKFFATYFIEKHKQLYG